MEADGDDDTTTVNEAESNERSPGDWSSASRWARPTTALSRHVAPGTVAESEIGSHTPTAFPPANGFPGMFGTSGDRGHVAWDIETTGFAWDDHVTVAGFWYPAGHADLLVNTAGHSFDTDACERQLRDVSGGVPVAVTATGDERGLIEAMRRILFDRFDREYNRLVAFNAEAWKGGFDLPFLRTRCARHGIEWVFDGVQFADLWDPVCKRLNTTHTAHGQSVEVNTLDGAHDLLFADASLAEAISEGHSDALPPYQQTRYDPFNDSGSAVTHYQRGEYRPVLQHNLADIHRTWELGELVRTYVAGSDVNTKTL